MVRGPLRTVLWVLGTLGVIWVVLWLVGLPAMGGMMGGNGMTMGGGGSGVGMGAMMGAMLVQTLGMLGLAGIFVYLLVDTLRVRRAGKDRPGPPDEPGR
jgi:hypothetical protein